LLHEHRHLRRRAQELEKAATDGSLRPEAARGFADELAAHSRRETEALYEWAEDALDEADRNAVLDAIRPKSRPPKKRKK
jgi:hypothetical protein